MSKLKLKCALAAALFTALVSTGLAEPSVPWAERQSFPEQQSKNEQVPLWERAIKDERRQKDAGITRTVPYSPPAQGTVAPAEQTTKPATNAEFKTLEKGSEGPLVEEAQEILLALGFGLPAGADGDFGGQTVDAVKAFQSSQERPLTGKLNKEDFDLLREIAPAKGKALWEDPASVTLSTPNAPLVKDKKARVLVDLSELRLCVYDSQGTLERVFPVASGAEETPTDTGIKVVTEKLEDPTKLAEKLWPDSKGKAFGKRLIDLNWYDPETKAQKVSDEELHGTYVLNSIGSRASHGCVRLTNENVEWLYQNLNLGDLVVIRE